MNRSIDETTDRTSQANEGAPFPVVLHELLSEAEQLGFQHIISWSPCGLMLKVHDKKQFSKAIMHRYFRQTLYKSFQRQLNLYTFSRNRVGHNRGYYWHPLFRQGRLDLCYLIRRTSQGGVKPPASSHPHAQRSLSDQQVNSTRSTQHGSAETGSVSASASGIGSTSTSTSTTSTSRQEVHPQLQQQHEDTKVDSSFHNTQSSTDGRSNNWTTSTTVAVINLPNTANILGAISSSIMSSKNKKSSSSSSSSGDEEQQQQQQQEGLYCKLPPSAAQQQFRDNIQRFQQASTRAGVKSQQNNHNHNHNNSTTSSSTAAANVDFLCNSAIATMNAVVNPEAAILNPSLVEITAENMPADVVDEIISTFSLYHSTTTTLTAEEQQCSKRENHNSTTKP